MSTPMQLKPRSNLMFSGDNESGGLSRQKTKGGKQFAKIWRQNTINEVKQRNVSMMVDLTMEELQKLEKE